MAVSTSQITQYWVDCDSCGIGVCCPDGKSENVHNQRQAIKWAGMHKVKSGEIYCDACYKEYKLSRRKQ